MAVPLLPPLGWEVYWLKKLPIAHAATRIQRNGHEPIAITPDDLEIPGFVICDYLDLVVKYYDEYRMRYTSRSPTIEPPDLLNDPRLRTATPDSPQGSEVRGTKDWEHPWCPPEGVDDGGEIDTTDAWVFTYGRKPLVP